MRLHLARGLMQTGPAMLTQTPSQALLLGAEARQNSQTVICNSAAEHKNAGNPLNFSSIEVLQLNGFLWGMAMAYVITNTGYRFSNS